MSEITITGSNFEKEVLKAELPVLVDFWAEWCGPCRMLSPIIADIAEEYDGKVRVGKVNVDQEQELAMKYNVANIPTLILFRGGKEIERSIGSVPKSRIEEFLKIGEKEN